MTNPLLQLGALGQSVWLDDIDREQLRSGLFERLIKEDGLRGATGNPTIFEHAITHGIAYDEQMRHLIAQRMLAQAIYETLAMTDVQQVADLLRPTYDRTDGQDGFVSISRVDVLIDRLLEELSRTLPDPTMRERCQALQGKIAIANARLAYQEFTQFFESLRFLALKAQGARVQRPLWASTGTKNPAYRDVRYVEELIGPETVNTMPLTTLERFCEHGQARPSIEEQLPEARAQLAALADVGIDYAQVTQQLQEEGVQKFLDSFRTLFACIEKKRQQIQL